MRLNSSAITPGGEIPRRFTCDGDDVSPPFVWANAPDKTQGFAIVCWDPDAPSGSWYHWAVFDIPATVRELADALSSESIGVHQAINDFGRRGYGGPCPPRGHGRHHYHFKIYALDIDRLTLAAKVRCRDVEKAAKAHALATAELVGIYGR